MHLASQLPPPSPKSVQQCVQESSALPSFLPQHSHLTIPQSLCHKTCFIYLVPARLSVLCKCLFPKPWFPGFFFWLLSLLTESLAAPVWTSPGRLLITISVYMSHLHVFLPTQHMDVGFSGRGKKKPAHSLQHLAPWNVYRPVHKHQHTAATPLTCCDDGFFFSLCKEFRKLLGNVHLIMQHTFLLSLLLPHSYTRTHSQLHSLSCLTCLP